MSDSFSPGCYKCGALDHVATNRNCPRPRTKQLSPSTADLAFPPSTPGNGRTIRHASQHLQISDSRPKTSKSVRQVEEAKFWYYEPESNQSDTLSMGDALEDTDESDYEVEDGPQPRHPMEMAEEHNHQNENQGSGSVLQHCPTNPEGSFSSPAKKAYSQVMSMNDFARQLQKASVSSLVPKERSETQQPLQLSKQRGNPPRPSNNNLPEAASPFVIKSSQKKRKLLCACPATEAQLFAPADIGIHTSKSSLNDTSAIQQQTPQRGGTVSETNAQSFQSLHSAHRGRALSRDWVDDGAVGRQGQKLSNVSQELSPVATWGELFEWYDRPENDEYSSYNRKKICYNYVSNRNMIVRPNSVVYGRHLQGWRECRSIGLGLGHRES